jgi:Outer membrane protein beta-barrel domain
MTRGSNHRGVRASAAAVCIAAGALGAAQALAQAPAPSQSPAPPESPAPPQPPAAPPAQGETYLVREPPEPAKAGPFYAFAGFAAFNPDTNGQLSHQRGDAANLLMGAGLRFSRTVSLELDFFGGGQKLDTPPGATPAAGTFKDGSLETRIDTSGFALSAKFNFLPVGRLEPYVAGGAGWYATRLRTTSEDPLCEHHCFDTGPRINRTSHDPGYHAAAGADYYFTAKDVLAAEVRYLRLEASFEDLVPGKVKAGGTFVWMGYRRYF